MHAEREKELLAEGFTPDVIIIPPAIIQPTTSIPSSSQSGTSSTPPNSSAAARVSPGIGSATLTVTARQHNQRLADYLRVLETPHYDQKIPTERDMLLRKLDRALDCLKEYPSKIESAEQALDAGIEGIGTKRSNLVRSSCSSFNFISFPLLGVANRPWFRLVELWKWLNSRRGGLVALRIALFKLYFQGPLL